MSTAMIIKPKTNTSIHSIKEVQKCAWKFHHKKFEILLNSFCRNVIFVSEFDITKAFFEILIDNQNGWNK